MEFIIIKTEQDIWDISKPVANMEEEPSSKKMGNIMMQNMTIILQLIKGLNLKTSTML